MILTRSIAAGVMISIGCIVYLSTSNPYIGAFLFSLGLISVITFKLKLCTGMAAKDYNTLELLFVIFMNILTSFIIAKIAFRLNPDLEAEAMMISAIKYSKGWVRLIFDGIGCGILIGTAIIGYEKRQNILIPIMSVMIFILCGFEHCVADAFYLANNTIDIDDYLLMLGYVAAGNIIGASPFAFYDMFKNYKQKEPKEGVEIIDN